jgi:hypothetical protein
MSESEKSNLHQRFITAVPFGLNSYTPYRVESDCDGFSLELRDCNGAQIISMAIDTDNGDIWVAALGAKFADRHALDYIIGKNRAKVTDVAKRY